MVGSRDVEVYGMWLEVACCERGLDADFFEYLL